jgi:type I restriction enzyme S subunit
MSSDELRSPLICPKSWQQVRLKDVATKIGSGATPTGGQAAYQETRTNYALVRSQNVFDRAFSEEGLAFISDSQAQGLRNAALQANDLLLNITGDGVTFGRACLVPESVLPACVNQHVSIIRLNSSRAHPGDVLSYLTHPTVKKYIEAFNAGGSRRAITKGHIESFVLPLPPMQVQSEIAKTLGALDDRITPLPRN